MTKLEQKLIELGYRKKSSHLYMKVFKSKISIHLNKINNIVMRYTLTCTPQDNLQQAFNQLQSDLKELELCQD